MQFIRKTDIPAYLRQRRFYHSLAENDDDPHEELSFPASVLKPDVTVHCLADCDYLLNSLRFWIVLNFIPAELVDFVLATPVADCSDLLRKYEAEIAYVRPLQLMAAASDCDRIKLAIESGVVEFVEGAVRRSCPFPPNSCDLAAAAGNVDVMKCLHTHGCILDNLTGNNAAKNGHVAMLKYLHEEGCTLTVEDLRAAAEGGHLECVKYMCPILLPAQSYFIERAIIAPACKHNHMSLLHYLNACEIDWSQHDCIHAARAGNLECLQFMHERGSSWDEDTIHDAAGKGHLGCLKYMHECGCPWNSDACVNAAEYGHFDCVQYLHEHGCPWDTDTCCYAAIGGHLNCLQYAHEHGCPLEGLGMGDLLLTDDNPCKAYLAQHGYG